MTEIRIIIGAGDQRWDGWTPTHKEQLDLLDRSTWARWFAHRRADALLCEHVFEHLTESEGRQAAKTCYDFLRPGGYLRVAVPDAFFPDSEYQRLVQVGGPGAKDHPAADHKMLYNHRVLEDVLLSAGFEVDALEFCDEKGRFHYNEWSASDGPIYRSFCSDLRNRDGKLGFVSLIMDAKRPA